MNDDRRDSMEPNAPAGRVSGVQHPDAVPTMDPGLYVVVEQTEQIAFHDFYAGIARSSRACPRRHPRRRRSRRRLGRRGDGACVPALVQREPHGQPVGLGLSGRPQPRPLAHPPAHPAPAPAIGQRRDRGAGTDRRAGTRRDRAGDPAGAARDCRSITGRWSSAACCWGGRKPKPRGRSASGPAPPRAACTVPRQRSPTSSPISVRRPTR